MSLPSKASKKAFVQEKFTSVTPRYDLLNTMLSLYIDHYWRFLTASLLRGCDSPILDICAGTLPLSREIVRQKKRTVVALDFCFDMLEYGMKRLGQHKNGHCILPVCGDGEALPLPDETFSGFSVAFGIRNLSNLTKGLDEMYRVLRPGGIAAILEFSRPSNPVFAPVYRFYLHRILPVLGGMISGDKEAYRYLAESIEGFYSQEEICNMMREAGFKDVSYRPLTMGIVTLYSGHRP